MVMLPPSTFSANISAHETAQLSAVSFILKRDVKPGFGLKIVTELEDTLHLRFMENRNQASYRSESLLESKKDCFLIWPLCLKLVPTFRVKMQFFFYFSLLMLTLK